MAESDQPPDRRTFLGAISTTAMAGGLVAGYGTFFGVAGRFLYPASGTKTGWVFVADVKAFAQGESRPFRTPAGASVLVTRQGSGDGASDFLALSSTCPHLGCQVHWEPQNDRFFCPCHNGTFDKSGKGTGGPPGDAGQSLSGYPLRVERGLLYMEVPLTTVAMGDGHDPCLRTEGLS